ncbi:MAG: class I SAM-dependent methyltransferase, partial [Methylococcales bacterium]|nr:class I SAM-dependent methyltransferase [Methylococcales bacterium]
RFETNSDQRFGLEVEEDRALLALPRSNGVVVGFGEKLPWASNSFDCILSNEVLEHTQDDRLCMGEMVRVTKPGGRILIFCPNRWYPFEQHGIYWRGKYRFGNIPLVNYLPNGLRDKLAPHVRAYTWRGLRGLFDGLPVTLVHHGRIFGGYDNIVNRRPKLGGAMKKVLYSAETTPFNVFGLSHLLVLQKS